MDRLFTVEVRWFFTGLVPAEVQDWFANRLPGSNLLIEKPRTDIYFIIHERDDLGLKLSRGSLELKWRRDAQAFSLNTPHITGVKETWIKEKWRYAKNHADKITKAFGKPNLKGWRLEIPKNRSVREYRADDSGEITALTQFLDFDALTGEAYAPVIKIELTTLSKGGKPGWTLGVEAAGKHDKLHEVFAQAVKELLKDHPQLDLQDQRSYGYPRWAVKAEE
jgi:hypothetical protein